MGTPDGVASQHGPGDPIFFISYPWLRVHGNRDAQNIKFEYVRELYEDLSANVADLIPLVAGQPPGFLDRASMTGGDDPWETTVIEAVSTCQVFVPLVTPVYPQRPWCEREWRTFARRRAVDRTTGRASRKKSILRVVWMPGGDLPDYITRVSAFIPADLPQSYVDHYLENGLYGLKRVYPAEFDAVAWKLALAIRQCWTARLTEPERTDESTDDAPAQGGVR